MNTLFVIIGFTVGAVIAYLFAERRGHAKIAALSAQTAAAEQRAADLVSRIDQQAGETQQLREKLGQSERSTAGLTAQLAAAQQNILEQRKLLDDAHAQLRESFASVSAEALAKNNE